MDAFRLTLCEAMRKIHANELSPSDLLESLLKRIEELEPKLAAWTIIDRDKAKEAAEECADEASEGRFRGPLHGIPVGIKDIYCTAGLKTTAGSKILADFVPKHDATVVARLKKAGAIILGKTETTEFAAFDPAPTRNPWNIEHTPGGSSSGSAAAVSSGMIPAALGSQTGGSTIRPASYCGIVGFKPTYGRVSRYGVIPVSWSLDHVGTFTRTVEDAALLLEVLSGYDPMDAASSILPVSSYRAALDEISPPRLGLVKEFFYDMASEEVKRNLVEVVGQLSNAGAKVLEAKLPESFGAAHAAQRVVMIAEAAAYHEETFRTQMMDYRPKMRGMIASGLLIPTSVYLKAQRIRTQFIREVYETLPKFSCLLMPSTPSQAPKGLESTGDPNFNTPWSFCGFPAITIRSGLSRDRMPLGIQLVGRPFDEETLLKAAQWCEVTLGLGHAPHDPE